MMDALADRKRLDRRFTATLLMLGVIGILAVGATWYASKFFARQTLENEHQRMSESWKFQIITLLDGGYRSFVSEKITTEDARILRQLTYSTDLYRISLLNGSGEVFWSTNLENPAKAADSAGFAATRNGRVRYERGSMQARYIDNMESLFLSGKASPNEVHQVVSATMPVNVGNQIGGAMVLRFDTSKLVAAHEGNIQRATLVLCGAFLLVSLVAGWFSYRHNRQRQDDVAALVESREQALHAETEARGMSTKLQKMNEDIILLNRELDRNLKQLHKAQNEIIRKGKMAQLGQLTATIAHDIRNPLGTVRTAAFLIERKFKDKAPGIEKPLDRINTGITRCDGIITELLDFARTSELNAETLRLDDWIGQNLAEQADRLPSAVEVTFTPGADDAEAEFDPGGMQRVLVNFLSNASEAMVGNGDDLERIATVAPKIEVTSAVTERGVEIRVTDNGPGMSEELKAKVLEPLFTTKNFGVGLGLPAVEKVLQQHGGGLDIESEEGSGTTMIAWFPVTQAESDAHLHGDGRHLKGSFLAA